MIEPASEAPKREEQVLVLAAGGLTDKEIAVRLGISPDTVGTYWRRVLAKYNAASRTEVVAKYMDQRSKTAIESLQYVNDCLTLLNEHMISHGAGGSSMADAILASVGDWILVIDSERKIVFSNRPVAAGSRLEELFDSEFSFSGVELAQQGPVEARWQHKDGPMFDFTLTPGVGSAKGHTVACGRIPRELPTD
jgi:DNA-binding CsgD family transcriptional regulator